MGREKAYGLQKKASSSIKKKIGRQALWPQNTKFMGRFCGWFCGGISFSCTLRFCLPCVLPAVFVAGWQALLFAPGSYPPAIIGIRLTSESSGTKVVSKFGFETAFSLMRTTA